MSSSAAAAAAAAAVTFTAKVPGAFSVAYAKIAGLPKAVLAMGALGVAATVAIIAVASGGNSNKEISMAFVGNRFLAINDLPRLMVAMSGGTWNQKSCLHSRGSLVTLLETGNGMYGLWHNQESAFDDERQVYDYGSCTVEQLFQGSDTSISYQNANGAYYDDGRNPCFIDDDFYSYIAISPENQTAYDFVIFADHAKRMAMSRDETVAELEDTYATYLQNNGAVPIVISPNAYWTSNSNMTGLDDLASFTSLIYEGSLEYADALSSKLNKKALVAPVSLGYLTVYEEDPDLWTMLFDSYDVHASVFGSYLIGCILYCTMTGNMPHKSQQSDVESLFSDARLLTGATWGYPDPVQAEYLWNVAKRVTKGRYKPKTLEM
jgi:hypothetical protein